jgi:hypothetical protein
MFWRLRISRNAPKHRLESGRTGFDLRVLPRNVSACGQAAIITLAAAGCGVQSALRRGLAQQLPDLLGDERNHRVQQPQQHVQRMRQHRCHRRAAFVLHPVLEHLDVEAAELVPGKVVQRAGGVGIVVVLQRLGHLLGHRRQPAEHPAVFDRQLASATGPGVYPSD